MRESLGDLSLLNKIREAYRNLIIPVFFILSILVLYLVEPGSFESTWKGRAPELIFLWLLFLELVLAWEKLKEKKFNASQWFIVISAITAAAPLIYVIGVFYFGLYHDIVELGKFVGVPFGRVPLGSDIQSFAQVSWPISLEYIFFALFFCVSLLLMYGGKGPKRFSVALFFLGATGVFYMIDTLYPFGTFTVLQAFAPVTASSAVHFLNWIGYEAGILGFYEGMPILYVAGLPGPNPVIGWPCAGIQSLFIYTFTILLFLKDAAISSLRKVVYVVIGAIGTFIVNVLRIVSYCVIGVNAGIGAREIFHKYYGELYFIVWIIMYLLVIIYGGRILTKLSTLVSKLKGS